MRGFLWLVFGLLLATNAVADVERPPNLQIAAADPSNPCSAFLGGWGGKYNNGREVEIWVLNVTKEEVGCRATVTYVSGKYYRKDGYVDEGGVRGVSAQINESAISFKFRDKQGRKGASVNFALKDETLKGTWVRDEDRVTATLLKIQP